MWMCLCLRGQLFLTSHILQTSTKTSRTSQPGCTGTGKASIGHIGLPSSSTKDCFVQPGVTRDIAVKSDQASQSRWCQHMPYALHAYRTLELMRRKTASLILQYADIQVLCS